MRGPQFFHSFLRRRTPASLFSLALAAAAAKTLGAAVIPLQNAAQPGCVLAAGTYHCDLQSLQGALGKARTVAIETQAMDRQTAAQLRHLVNELGKQPASVNQSADLIFLLTPVQSPGIDYGPGDHDLATLRIYSADSQGGRGGLLWAETLRGQGDRPWPAQVQNLIQQFQGRLSGR